LPAVRSHSAVWSPHDSLKGSPRVAGSKGHAPRVIDTGLARHGVDTEGAAALRPAPWVAVDTTAAAGLERAWERRLVAKCALAGQEGGASSSAYACARQPATARPWRRGRRVVRTGGPAQEKGQRPSLASRVTVRACRGARLREGVAARTDTRADANANANTTRTRRQRRGGDQDGVAPYG
jgi:hypothetical protein